MGPREQALRCPAMETLHRVIGGKWKISILFYISLLEERRFGQLKRSIAGISESTLSKQLKELVADGLIDRIDFNEVPPRVEYQLTERGESFKPLLLAMWAPRCRKNVKSFCLDGTRPFPAVQGQQCMCEGAGVAVAPLLAVCLALPLAGEASRISPSSEPSSAVSSASHAA